MMMEETSTNLQQLIERMRNEMETFSGMSVNSSCLVLRISQILAESIIVFAHPSECLSACQPLFGSAKPKVVHVHISAYM